MKHFLVSGSVLSPQQFSHLILTITLEDKHPFAEEEMEEQRVTELESDEGRGSNPESRSPRGCYLGPGALTYNNSGYSWKGMKASITFTAMNSTSLPSLSPAIGNCIRLFSGS